MVSCIVGRSNRRSLFGFLQRCTTSRKIDKTSNNNVARRFIHATLVNDGDVDDEEEEEEEEEDDDDDGTIPCKKSSGKQSGAHVHVSHETGMIPISGDINAHIHSRTHDI